MAIRKFNCPRVVNRDISNIDNEACLKFYTDVNGNVKNSINGRRIRSEIHKYVSPDTLPALKEWSRQLNKFTINWNLVLENLFKGSTNNFKLIQFQFKLLMRISTCKYMRYKMNIAKDNDQCSLCHMSLETLEHIFIHCQHTKFSRIN